MQAFCTHRLCQTAVMQPCVLVADIGGTKIALGHAQSGQVSNELDVRSSDALRVANPVAALEQTVRDYCASHGLASLDAVVIGVPASLDRDLDTVLSSPNIVQLEQLKLSSGLRERLSVPVFLERDINLLLLGEYRAGVAQRSSSVLGAFFGTGVGASLLVNGAPYRGYSVGLELGHIPFGFEGRRCVCGNTDCLEAYACGHILRELSTRYGIPVEALFTRRSADSALDSRLSDLVRDQARSMATAINLFDPETAVVGGGIPNMTDFPQAAFFETVRQHLRRPYPRETVTLDWARLGSAAAIHGALAVLEQRTA